MGLFRKIIYSFFLFLLVSILGLSSVFAVTGEHPVLIIGSYNLDARQTSGNIYDFMEEFERLGGKAPIALENMNCKSFSESPQWKSKMTEILDKYEGKRTCFNWSGGLGCLSIARRLYTRKVSGTDFIGKPQCHYSSG